MRCASCFRRNRDQPQQRLFVGKAGDIGVLALRGELASHQLPEVVTDTH